MSEFYPVINFSDGAFFNKIFQNCTHPHRLNQTQIYLYFICFRRIHRDIKKSNIWFDQKLCNNKEILLKLHKIQIVFFPREFFQHSCIGVVT